MASRYLAWAVLAGLTHLLLSTGAMLVDDPQDPPDDPPPSDPCDCEADWEVQDFDCEGEGSAVVTPLQDGQCDVPPCTPRNCRYEYPLSWTWPGPRDWWIQVNGLTRGVGYGHFVELLSVETNMACGQNQEISIGSGSQPCVEVLMACWPCPSGN